MSACNAWPACSPLLLCVGALPAASVTAEKLATLPGAEPFPAALRAQLLRASATHTGNIPADAPTRRGVGQLEIVQLDQRPERTGGAGAIEPQLHPGARGRLLQTDPVDAGERVLDPAEVFHQGEARRGRFRSREQREQGLAIPLLEDLGATVMKQRVERIDDPSTSLAPADTAAEHTDAGESQRHDAGPKPDRRTPSAGTPRADCATRRESGKTPPGPWPGKVAKPHAMGCRAASHG